MIPNASSRILCSYQNFKIKYMKTKCCYKALERTFAVFDQATKKINKSSGKNCCYPATKCNIHRSQSATKFTKNYSGCQVSRNRKRWGNQMIARTVFRIRYCYQALKITLLPNVDSSKRYQKSINPDKISKHYWVMFICYHRAVVSIILEKYQLLPNINKNVLFCYQVN